MTDSPTVYCVVPVYNRLEITKRFLEHIAAQDYPAIHTVIVDDGSTDGTGEYLAHTQHSRLTTLTGSGNLWWGGAMHLGMGFVMDNAGKNDFLLMLNDDVRIGRNYISTLVVESMANGNAVIGSSQRDEVSGQLLGSGVNIDYWGMRFSPVDCVDSSISVDALPGRGVLIPMQAVFAAGKVNSRIFPHYLGDLEYTARVKESGYEVILSNKAEVFSAAESSDEHVRRKGFIAEYFSFRSKRNLVHRILFFCLRGPFLSRILAVPRFPITLIAKIVRR
jgi:GT2 family glycosyltransferase